MYNISNAFVSEKSRKDFLETLPPPDNGKFDGDILIPVAVHTKQLNAMMEHYKKFMKSNQKHHYLTAMWRHGADAGAGPHKYIITSLWAIKQDVQLFKDVGAPFPIMLKWFNTEQGVELISRFVKVREFNREDIQKYIHYNNVYLTQDKAICLHYKGQR